MGGGEAEPLRNADGQGGPQVERVLRAPVWAQGRRNGRDLGRVPDRLGEPAQERPVGSSRGAWGRGGPEADAEGKLRSRAIVSGRRRGRRSCRARREVIREGGG